MTVEARLRHTDGMRLVLDVETTEAEVPRRRWHVEAVHQGRPRLASSAPTTGNLAIVRCEVAADGAPPMGHIEGGIDFDEARLPRKVAYAVERELSRLWHADDHARIALRAAGFTTQPLLMRGRSGRPPVSEWITAVRVRRALASPRASDEKLFSYARSIGILHRPSRSREFTRGAIALLQVVDAAKAALVDSPSAAEAALLPFPREAVEAALTDLGTDESR